MTLTEFLLARIAEDEAAATAARFVVGDDLTDHDEPRWWVKEEHGRVYAGHWNRLVDGGAPMGDRSFANTAALPHIARHDPARVLAECEAKRRIVEWHEVKPNDFTPGSGCRICDVVGGDIRGDGPCLTVRWLALPYADHADYREEWKP